MTQRPHYSTVVQHRIGRQYRDQSTLDVIAMNHPNRLNDPRRRLIVAPETLIPRFPGTTS
jgi:hypothetical protein